MITIKIGSKSYSVNVARTDEERMHGLQDTKKLPQGEGMLFIYDEPRNVGYWMKDTTIPLDIIFINEDEEVISVKQGTPMSKEMLEEDNVAYVLEVNQDSGIKPGDELEFEQESNMQVLAPDGSIQMHLDGGERIVSRKQTLILIRKAIAAYNSKDDKDYRNLGKYMFRILRGQNERPPEYVESTK